MFVKGIIFKNVDPQKHQKCSTHQKYPKIRCLQAFSLIQSRQRTSLQDTAKTINLHMLNSLPLSDKVMSVQSISFVPFKKLLMQVCFWCRLSYSTSQSEFSKKFRLEENDMAYNKAKEEKNGVFGKTPRKRKCVSWVSVRIPLNSSVFTIGLF